MSLTLSSLQKLGKIQTGVFPISGFLVNPSKTKIVVTPWTSHDIDMKLEPVIKLDKRSMETLKKKIDDDVISVNCEVIVFFSIYGNFGAIRKPDFGRMVCRIYIFIDSDLLSYKTWKQN